MLFAYHPIQSAHREPFSNSSANNSPSHPQKLLDRFHFHFSPPAMVLSPEFALSNASRRYLLAFSPTMGRTITGWVEEVYVVNSVAKNTYIKFCTKKSWILRVA